MSSYRHIDVREVGDVTVVRFRDRKIIEDATVQRLGQELFDLVDREQRKKLLIDYLSVVYQCAAFLGKMITLDKKVKAIGGVLKLCNIPPEIYEVFEITKLSKLFDVQVSEADALATF